MRLRLVSLALTLSMPGVVFAQAGRVVDSEAPAEPTAPAATAPVDESVAGAEDTIKEVMGFIEKAKWKELKARIHPYTIKAMEERKKRTKREDHNLAFWVLVKEWKFQKWEVAGVEAGPRGTAIVTTKEDHFMVEEKGVEEGKDAEWLLVKEGGKWLILDRRNGTGNFTATAVEKGFADALPKATEGEASKSAATPQAAYAAKLEKAIRAKLKVPEEIPENQLKVMSCGVKIMVDDGGGILSRAVDKPSGNPAFDKAIIRAIDAAQPLPAPDDAVAEDAKKGVIVTFKGKP